MDGEPERLEASHDLRRLSLKPRVRNLLEHLDSDRATYVIVAAGLMLRIIALAMVGARSLTYENPAYYEMGLKLLRGESFSPYWPPGVPYFLAAFHWIFGDGMLVARALMLPIYVAFSCVLYLLVRETSTPRAGNLAVLVFSVYPSYIRWSFNPSTEYPAAASLVAVVYLVVVATRRPSRGLSIGLGILLGALVLIRPSTLSFIVLAPFYVFLKTRKTRAALLSTFASLLLVSAWLWKAYTLAGRFVFINDSNAQNLFLSNNPFTPLYNTCPGGPVEWAPPEKFTEMQQAVESEPPAIRQKLYREIAFRHIVSRPDLFLLRTFNRFRAYFCFPIHRGDPLIKSFRVNRGRGLLGVALTLLELCFYWPLMALAIVFLFNFRRSFFERDYVAPILGAVLVYAIPHWLTCSQPRYNFPAVPLLAVFAVILVNELSHKPWAEALRPVLGSIHRRTAVLAALAVFFAIQIEWILYVAGWRFE